jgi:hypothetical protein
MLRMLKLKRNGLTPIYSDVADHARAAWSGSWVGALLSS